MTCPRRESPGAFLRQRLQCPTVCMAKKKKVPSCVTVSEAVDMCAESSQDVVLVSEDTSTHPAAPPDRH